jgi:hypothetical protein
MLFRGGVALTQTVNVRLIEYVQFHPDLELIWGEYIVGKEMPQWNSPR